MEFFILLGALVVGVIIYGLGSANSQQPIKRHRVAKPKPLINIGKTVRTVRKVSRASTKFQRKNGGMF